MGKNRTIYFRSWAMLVIPWAAGPDRSATWASCAAHNWQRTIRARAVSVDQFSHKTNKSIDPLGLFHRLAAPKPSGVAASPVPDMARESGSSRAATPAAGGDQRKRKRDAQGGRSVGNSTPQSPAAGGSSEHQLVVAANPAPASARPEPAHGHETASSSRPPARRPRSSGSRPSGGMRQLGEQHCSLYSVAVC